MVQSLSASHTQSIKKESQLKNKISFRLVEGPAKDTIQNLVENLDLIVGLAFMLSFFPNKNKMSAHFIQ